MTDPRVAKMARVLVEYSLAVQAGDLVRIQGAPGGAPLLLALYEAILARGGHPWTQISLDGTDEIFYTKADDAQLDFLPKFVAAMIEEIQASVSVWTETNTKRLTNADPAKQARRAQATRQLNERFLERAAKKELKWTGTVYPTHAFAQDAECRSASSRILCMVPAWSTSPTRSRPGRPSPRGSSGWSIG